MILPKGTTNFIDLVFIPDTSKSDGSGKTGLVYNSSGLAGSYCRNSGTRTGITLADMTLGAFTSGGFKEIDATNMPGWYQFCPPDAMLATGAEAATYNLFGAADMLPVSRTIQLAAVPADITHINGGATNGNNATLSLKALDISNNAGNAISATSTGSNGHGLALTGHGAGHGTYSQGGSTGSGVVGLGGASAGNGANFSAQANAVAGIVGIGVGVGEGMYLSGGSGGAGLRAVAGGSNANGATFTGSGSGSGIAGTGGATGHGGLLTGGATSGSGLRIVAAAGNSDAVSIAGHGTGNGIYGTGGTGGGAGFLFEGGTDGASTSGIGGIIRRPSEGVGSSNGLVISGTVGIAVTGGITAAITGNITGNLSGSVGSVSGNVGGNVTGSVGSVVGSVGSISGITFPTNFSATVISAGGLVSANLKAIEGDTTDGFNATLKLKQLDIENSAGHALIVSATGSGNKGCYITSGSNNAFELSAGTGTGHGFVSTGGTSGGRGMSLGGAQGGAGFYAQGGATGHGMHVLGGATSGDGLLAAVGGSGVPIRGNFTGNITGDLSGSVGSVAGAVGSVTGNVGGNVTGTIGGLTAAALADFFDTNSGTTYGSAVAGSVVKEIADNASGSGGGITLATGTVSASHTNSELNRVKLATGASSLNDFYNGETISFSDNQARTIVDYDGGNRLAYFDHNLISQLVAGTTTYTISPAGARADALLDIPTIETGISFRKILRAFGAFVAGGRKKPSSDVIEFYAAGQAAEGTPRIRFNSVDSQGQTGTSSPDLNLT